MSDLARQLIAENKRTRATFLDLGNCGLSEIPPEVGELVWIEFLSLSNEAYENEEYSQRRPRGESQNTGEKNRLTSIRQLAGLTNLRSLQLDQAADLTPLVGLTNLQQLIVHTATAGDLTPLADLTALQELTTFE